jgi:2-polyprenyl-6-hydroxyphenyl methylase/3-demethylubiquinone-9 3-methyltransferase
MPPGSLVRNDVRQYDLLAGEWWRPGGDFAMLHWLARARAALLPKASRPGAVLLDLGCGGGLLAPHVAGLGYRHVGVDLVPSALRAARAHRVEPVQADVARLPFPDGCADAVSAGEILEHVPDLSTVVGEACRVLRPGGTLVLDTLAATPLARFLAVTVAERLPRGAPPGLHDPELFVDRRRLLAECARHGVALTLHGIRPALLPLARWYLGRRELAVRIRPTWSTAVLFQGVGVKGVGVKGVGANGVGVKA